MSHTSFRFRAKNVFLTYPRCPIGPEFLCDHLWNLVTPYDPLYVHVAQENHKDGGLHSHVLIQTRIEISTFDPTYFDYTGTSIPGAVVFHPNIQACRNVRDCLAYIRKNTINEVSKGAFKCSGAGRPKKQDPAPSRDAKMCQIMSSATSRSDYLSMVRGAFPFEWATKLAQFEYSASKLFPDAPTTNAIPSNIDLTCHENIMPWLRDDLYTVSEFSYFLCTGSLDPKGDLTWMAEHTRNEGKEDVPEASTYAEERGRARQHGQEASGHTTTSNTRWTTSPGAKRPRMSS
uniref:Replication-associated protein n=1 Tax=maize striate mosaic virus TaxID=2025388 RepID=A0A286QV43_9GEMI|nr:RepA [Maize striate mosaic virus]